MAGQIPQNFIDDLLERVDIVEVIDRRVPLKKAGKNYKACCPFHNEKTPSFNVQPDKQYYHCFGCGAGGNAVSFLLDYENLNFVEAIEALAAMAGVEVPREQDANHNSQHKQRINQLYDAINFAAGFFQSQLRQHANKAQVVSYLKQRGLTGEVARDFNIGYAPPGWDNLVNAATQAFPNAKDKMLKQLESAGLLVAKDNGGYYDRFRERVMFPIRDNRGRIIAFGGRVLNEEKPKYLNSPESEVFHKQRELYGLYEARKSNRQLDQIVLVEGYLDVISLSQFGISYAVATLGTASGEVHLEKIFRHTHKLIVCFDGDAAGTHAAERVFDIALPAMQDGREIHFLFLPEGSDPDSYVREHGKLAFEHLCDNARPLEELLLEQAGKDATLDTEAGKTRCCQNALPFIQRLPEGIFKHRMLTRLAEHTDTPRDLLAQQLADLPAPRNTRQTNSTSKQVSSPSNALQHQNAAMPDQSKHQLSRESIQDTNRPDNTHSNRSLQASRPAQPASPTVQSSISESNETALMWSAAAVLSHPILALNLPLPADQPITESPMDKLLHVLVSFIKSQDRSTGTMPSTESLVGRWHGEPESVLIMRCLNAEIVPANKQGAKQLLDDALRKIKQNQKKAELEALAKELGNQSGKMSDSVKARLKALSPTPTKKPSPDAPN